MLEFVSIKVLPDAHNDLATQLTAQSRGGWNVVSIVSAGDEIVAFLSRPVVVTTPATAAGWAATTSDSAEATTPTMAPTTTVPSVPADWYKDPAGRYDFRYWDGSKWTENVSRAGVRFTDPPTK
ncbi:unannotated protein [freshwater metagenome]|uniref:Unannotated protein n=1 Tax=freshwater metagenome TaxID=449393 RepID=A0A6J6C9A6_9ZZZZ